MKREKTAIEERDARITESEFVIEKALALSRALDDWMEGEAEPPWPQEVQMAWDDFCLAHGRSVNPNWDSGVERLRTRIAALEHNLKCGEEAKRLLARQTVEKDVRIKRLENAIVAANNACKECHNYTGVPCEKHRGVVEALGADDEFDLDDYEEFEGQTGTEGQLDHMTLEAAFDHARGRGFEGFYWKDKHYETCKKGETVREWNLLLNETRDRLRAAKEGS
jgi:hypothetical protein